VAVGGEHAEVSDELVTGAFVGAWERPDLDRKQFAVHVAGHVNREARLAATVIHVKAQEVVFVTFTSDPMRDVWPPKAHLVTQLVAIESFKRLGVLGAGIGELKIGSLDCGSRIDQRFGYQSEVFGGHGARISIRSEDKQLSPLVLQASLFLGCLLLQNRDQLPICLKAFTGLVAVVQLDQQT
jgi:hypothetical protein